MIFNPNLLNSKFEDVTLGYHTLQPNYDNPCFFGCTILNTTQKLLNKQPEVESKLRNLREDEMNVYENYFKKEIL